MHRDMGLSLLPETLGHKAPGLQADWDRFAAGCWQESTQPGRETQLADDGQGVAAGAVDNLSDPQMEEALQDRISFRRFVGLGLQDDTPDYSTIFRATLEELGITRPCSRSWRPNWTSGDGTLMDATLVKAHVRRPSTAGRGAKNPDADWTKTHRLRSIWVWTPARGWCLQGL